MLNGSAAASPVVLCHVGGIGDHYLALPAMRALVDFLGPDVRLAGHPSAMQLIYGELGTNGGIIDFTIDGSDLARDVQAVADEIGDCELLVSLMPFSRGLANQLVSAVKPNSAVGFELAYGVSVALNEKQHAVDMYLDVPRALGANWGGKNVVGPPQLPPRSLAFAHELRGKIPPDMKLLVVHADTKPDKMWEPRRFTELIHGFAAGHAEVFVLIVGSIDFGLTDGPFEARVASCINIPLLDSFALVSQADTFLGVDSCMLHVADFFRIPSVGLFGATDSRHWGLRFARGTIVEGYGSMDHISVGDARDALEAVWSTAANRRS